MEQLQPHDKGTRHNQICLVHSRDLEGGSTRGRDCQRLKMLHVETGKNRTILRVRISRRIRWLWQPTLPRASVKRSFDRGLPSKTPFGSAIDKVAGLSRFRSG